MNTMLTGLCNLCDDYGHTNFDLVCELFREIENLGGETTNVAPSSAILDYCFDVKKSYS